MIPFKLVKLIDVGDWDNLVTETYGKPYSFQQQDGCRDRGIFYLTIPNHAMDYENTSIPEVVNGDIMGVRFESWLSRDPKAPLADEDPDYSHMVDLFWERNFYPDIQTVANDLYAKGKIDAGSYIIDIDW